MTIDNIWTESLSLIEQRVGLNIFEHWFAPIKLIQIKDQSAVIEIPNRFFKEWIEDYYPTLLGEVLEKTAGQPLGIRYKIAEKEDRALKRMGAMLENRKSRLASKGIYLNPKYTFDSFVTGASNQFAHAASKAVAESPGKTYNPLFIYGGVGLGKTHLLSAIGNSIVDQRGDMNMLFVSSEQFTNEVVHTIRHGKTEELKAKYRNLDLLLMDDVQFVENKTATQEELFHTLNSLYEKQKQIVLTSDRPPKEIKSVTDRLRSRFNMGLIADIQAPDVETKVAILHKKADAERIKLPEDVIYFLSSKIKSNIRELEGCLIRLAAHASLTGSPIDLAMARNILKDIIHEDDRPLTPETIMKAVSEHYGMKVNDLKAKKRTKDIALPRQVAMYISRELTDASLSEIGKTAGGKDHATVIYACKQVEGKKAKDEAFARMIETLINKIKP
jgi:chromosomal replication initiator protein